MGAAEISGVRATVARSVDELEAVRPAWEQLRGYHVTADPEYFETVLEALPGAVRPHVVALERDGEPIAVALGRIENVRLPARIGLPRGRRSAARGAHARVRRGAGQATPRSHGAPAPGRAPVRRSPRRRPTCCACACSRSARRCTRSRARRRARSPRQRFATPERPLAGRDPRLAGGLSRRAVVQDAPRTSATTIGASSTTFGDRFSLETFEDAMPSSNASSGHPRVCRRRRISTRSVRRSSTARVQRAVFELGLRRGWLRAYLLYIDGEPVAFWHGSAHRGVLGPGMTGYDPAFHDVRAGSYVLVRRIEEACATRSSGCSTGASATLSTSATWRTAAGRRRRCSSTPRSWKGLRANCVADARARRRRAGASLPAGRLGLAREAPLAGGLRRGGEDER